MLLAHEYNFLNARRFCCRIRQKNRRFGPERTSGLQTQVQFPVEKRRHSRTARLLTKRQKNVKFRVNIDDG
jgi:hypothetical protein